MKGIRRPVFDAIVLGRRRAVGWPAVANEIWGYVGEWWEGCHPLGDGFKTKQ